MSAIILTWDEDEDIHIVSNEFGTNIVFDSVENADEWSWNNSGMIGNYQKIIDLDE